MNNHAASVNSGTVYACLSIVCSCLLVIIAISDANAATPTERKPNVIIILADDLGYGDLSCYGADDIATPNIDRMASEGIKFNSFYVSPVCSPTRASLITGSHSTRVGIGGVMFPRNNHGLNPHEITLPELLKGQGYATAIIGKWHLGNQDMFQPLVHGFDYWYGTPSSNSQFYYPTIKKYAADCVFREGYTRDGILKRETAACPLVRDNIVIEVPADQTQFTQRYTRETIRFLTQNKDKPFFVYLAHNMPHIPLHASEKFVGSSRRGIYGDTIQELDWSTGEILRALKEIGLDQNTLVIFTSDNGPNTSTGGTAGPLKGGKGSTLEGGVRVPFVARWPGKIPAGIETDEAITGMDLLPTLTKLAGGEVPDERVIDGKDISPLLSATPDAKSPHEAIFYLRGRGVDAIRVGDWKYRIAADKPPKKKGSKGQPAGDSKPKKVSVETLYNLRDSVGEQTNLIDEHPEIAARLKKRMEDFHNELRKNTRPAAVAESTKQD
ncbi:sulfatase family protein [Rubripirellula reticaptiva]|uniref:Arylsulfatase n=1 Tax=Rubripirellula reticaptiva TaxID=2528013 RepID=A0A5C6EEX1_9BACT|nr:sulfatase [Rubripirellula reticaptiva]TWU46547.1 Arylsulfatase precursor [Rubripirellula reticaptiva]